MNSSNPGSFPRVNYELIVLFVLVGVWSGASEVIWKALPFQLILLGIPVVALGVLQSANIAANLVTELPAGIYVDRRGRKSAIVGGFVAMGVSIAFLALSRDILMILVSIFLISVADSLFLRGGTVRFFEAARTSAKGRGTALFGVAVAIGGFAGLGLSGILSQGSFGSIFLFVALLVVVVGLGSRRFLGDTKRPDESKPTARSPRAHILRRSFAVLRGDFAAVKDKRFLGLSILVQAFMSLSAGSSFVFVPVMGLGAGLTPSQILLVFAIVQLASAPSSYFGGWVSDRLAKSWFFVARPVSAAITYGILAIAMNPSVFIAGVAMLVVVSFLGPGSSAYFWGRFDEGDRGKAGSANTFFSSAIGVAAPLLGSVLWTVSPVFLFFFAAVATLPAVIVSLVALQLPNKAMSNSVELGVSESGREHP